MIKGLPEKLRDLRVKYGFSQKVVAKRLGVSTSIISSYETGERTPSVDNLLQLSYLYQCSTDFLLGRDTVSNCLTIDVNGLDARQITLLRELVSMIQNK